MDNVAKALRPFCPKRQAVWRIELFDSDPPLVKMISAGDAPTSAATCSRAFSIASAGERAAENGLDGLAKLPAKKGCISARTSE